MKPFTALTIPSMKAINARRKHWTAASMFAGCGGASVGLKMAGARVAYANEFIPGAARTYRANAPDTRVDTRDVRTIDGKDVMRACGVRRGELDWLDGSPPCKMYSSASRHARIGKAIDEPVLYSEGVWQRVDDLFENHLRIVRQVMPRIASIENVTGLAESSNIGFFDHVCTRFRACGYNLEVRMIDPSRLGVPQTRVRIVFLGIRNDLYKKGLRHAWPAPYASHPITVRDVVPQALWIAKSHGEWQDSRRPSPTLTVVSGRSDEFSGLSAGPFFRDAHGDVFQYNIPELKRLFGFPQDFVLGGDYYARYERLARSHAPLAVYNIAGTMLQAMEDWRRR